MNSELRGTQVSEDALYPLWWLAALRGLRRGEFAGLRWADIGLETRELTVVQRSSTSTASSESSHPKARRASARSPWTPRRFASCTGTSNAST
jgi:integrase